MWDLKGKTALVTGGSSGIGKAIVKELLKAGASVLFFGTNPEKGQKAKQELQEFCQNEAHLEFFAVDVSDKKAVDEWVKQHPEAIDILVNNAGITKDQLLMRMSEDDWDSVMDINVKSCYNLCHALVRQMMKARSGKIINISSVVGLTGNVGQANYAASKAAMIGFTKAIAKELAGRNITANCVAPGYIQTEMTGILTEDQQQKVLNEIPLNKMGKPEDIAYLVLYLASSLSDYITGQVFVVDGGMTI